MAFEWIKRRRQREDIASGLYTVLVAQTRRPAFYATLGVPDSVEGRFDLLLVHAFLLFHRLKSEGAPAEQMAQDVFDLMFADLDQNLREMGIGDMGIGKRIRRMSEAYHGRVVAYEEGLAGDAESLRAALKRNLYAAAEPRPDQLAAMDTYIRREIDALAQQSFADLAAGKLRFGPAPELPTP